MASSDCPTCGAKAQVYWRRPGTEDLDGRVTCANDHTYAWRESGVTVVQKYMCNTCSSLYSSRKVAEACYAAGIGDPPFRPGDVVEVEVGPGASEIRKIKTHFVQRDAELSRLGADYFNEDEFRGAKVPVHVWAARLDRPVFVNGMPIVIIDQSDVLRIVRHEPITESESQ